MSSARQLRELASPVRQDVLDAVAAIGPCSVSQLAGAIGRPADGLYYHVRRLMRARLLAASGSEGRRGELWLDVAHPGFHLKYQPDDPRNRSAVLRVIAAMLRSSERSFRRAFRPGAVVSGARRNLWAGRARGALSPSELAAVNALLVRLATIMRAGRQDRSHAKRRRRKLYEFAFVLAPTFRQGR